MGFRSSSLITVRPSPGLPTWTQGGFALAKPIPFTGKVFNRPEYSTVEFLNKAGEKKVRSLQCKIDLNSPGLTTGELVGPRAINDLVIHYPECEVCDQAPAEFRNRCAAGVACTSPAAAFEEIVTKPLVGELVYLKAGATLGAKLPVGIVVKPAAGKVIAEFTCGIVAPVNLTIEGEMVGEVRKPQLNKKERVKGVVELRFSLFGFVTPGTQQWTQIEEAGPKRELTFSLIQGAYNESALTFQLGKPPFSQGVEIRT